MTAGVFSFLALTPVFALVGAYVFLGESVTIAQLAGGALVVAVALLAARRSRPPSSTAQSKELQS